MRRPITALFISAFLLTGCAAPSKGTVQHAGAGRPPAPAADTAPGCIDETIVRDLQIAADAKLPVPTTIITATTLPAPTVQEFVAATGVEPEADAVRQAQSVQNWVFHVDGEQVSLWVDIGASTFIMYKFPRGELAPEADVPELAAQLRGSLARLQVGATRMKAMLPQTGPSEYQVWYGSLDLRAVAMQSRSAPAWMCDSWSRRQVPGYATGTIPNFTVDMLDLGNGVWLGFSGRAFIIQSIKSGIVGTTWYEIPDLIPVPPPLDR